MEFDELLITTGVDALVRLVKEKQRIELEEASSILNIPQETLEDWARVLEEENILRIDYRLTKVYFSWVKPTEEEIATEKQSFYDEKKDVETQVEKFRQKATSETTELKDLKGSFDGFYAKMYAKVEELEKKVSPLPAAKALTDDALSKYMAELGTVDTKLADVKAALGNVKSEINSLEIHKTTPSEKLIEKIDVNNNEIAAMRQNLEEFRKKIALQDDKDELSLPTIKDVKKKFDALQKDFAALRSKNAQIKEDMLSLHESSEILKTVTESIMGQEDRINTLRKEAKELAVETEAIVEKTSKLSVEAKKNLDLMERLGSSVEIAKNVINKFPSHEKVMVTLDKLRADEEVIVEKNEALGKIIEAAGGKQITARQASELVKKLDEKIEHAKHDVDALEAALNDEKGTYLTFQKIKERIVPSLEGYQTQLDMMEQRITKINDETREQIKTIKSEAQKLEASLKDDTSQMGEMVKVAQEIKQKKKLLDDIKKSFDDLAEMSDNLNKRATLLSSEAKLLEIRASTGTPSASEALGIKEKKEKGVKQQLELSEEEELEFRKKREELKKLIQKLWEE